MRLAIARYLPLRWSVLCAAAVLISPIRPSFVCAATLQPGDFVMAAVGAGNSACCQVVTLDPITLAVSQVSSDGLIQDPIDIAVTGRGDILLTTPTSGVIRIDAATGGQTVFASLASLGGGTPAGILVSAGAIYITMRAVQPRVLELAADGSIARIVSSGGLLQDPSGIAVGPDGALYVCETIPLGALSGGGLVRVELESGSQTLIASGEPLYGPFDLAFASDGWLWSIQRGYLRARHAACVVRTRVSDGYSERVDYGFCRTQGLVIREDGLTVVADCVPIHGDCESMQTRIYPDGPYAPIPISGPIAVVPDRATPTTRATWGRVKVIYR